MQASETVYEPLRLGNQLCFPLYACAKEIVRQYRKPLAPLDLTYTQYIVMMVLWEFGEMTEDSPFMHEVTIRNDGETPWSGIIRMDLPFEAASPRFFMPGFLYGTNRGDAPLQTGSKAPRLRTGNPDFPASSWWMTRSDRLSHPAVFAFTGNRIVGLCASPYYLKADGRITPWAPGVSGDWLQYAGFGCDLDRRLISYTHSPGQYGIPGRGIRERRYCYRQDRRTAPDLD